MKALKKTSGVFVAIALATGLAACAQSNANETAMQKDQMAKADIVDTAVSAGKFNTLVAAVKAADLVETLKSPGPFTVFAPTDAAFDKLPAGTVETLLKPENKDKLIQILTYHVVSGKVMSSDIAGKKLDAGSVEGSKLMINAQDGGVMINDASVVAADVESSNGVIHIIDTVLLPKS
ncbi:fasciclin domain-containing protein [Sneathiella sp. P13V-1]|nr:fasciclin domain-containing protein [Sneathiella sp. P13V-1]MBE7636611.1 fasciclin domain-containing protein [Sneathiella sp. P13V-1]